MAGTTQHTKRPSRIRARTAGPTINCGTAGEGRRIGGGGGATGGSQKPRTGASSAAAAGRTSIGVKNKKSDVRFGNKEGGGTNFGSEERFAWQKSKYASDAMYTIPDVKAPPFSFGTSTRADWKKIMENTKDLYNPNSGPANYKTGNEYELLSESPSRRDITFGTAPRESMDLMTASPGVLYKVDGVFRNGPVKGKILPGFNLDSRKPLAENLKSTTAAIYSPKLASKVQVARYFTAMQERFQGTIEGIGRRSPGPIYDVAKYGGPTGPKFSFGASRRDRWGNMRMPTIA
ncbi:unnamed protein product [Scytosiphon promiscuus]